MSPETIPHVAVKEIRILALCDNILPRPNWPVTGFGRVANNLLRRFQKQPGYKVTIDVWAVGFDGWNYDQLPEGIRLLPVYGRSWNSAEALKTFTDLLQLGMLPSGPRAWPRQP
jgi:hypothetical protein